MSPEQIELLDLAILRVLDANRTRFGIGLTALGMHLSRFGFTAGEGGGEEAFRETIAERLDYLGRKQMVEEARKVIDRAVRAWRITPQGMSYVDERG